MAQIICKDLSLGYNGSIITQNINFSINHGDYLCIVGENGSGKSTLIKTLLGLIAPLHGSIEFKDKLTHSRIGYLPQQTDSQKDFPASVWEIVLSGATALKPHFWFCKKEKALALSNMQKLGIDRLRNKSFKELSGGQQQRVLLARALCAASDILILDEPVSGLDPNVSLDLYNILKDLNHNHKMTVVMVSHDISAALNFATHILHIGTSQVFFGTTKEYQNNDISFKAEGRKNV